MLEELFESHIKQLIICYQSPKPDDALRHTGFFYFAEQDSIKVPYFKQISYYHTDFHNYAMKTMGQGCGAEPAHPISFL